MPIPGGTAGAHDDAMHQGSAKRDVADGVAGLNGTGSIIIPGSTIYLTRDGGNNIYIYERGSVDSALKLERIGGNDFIGSLSVGGAWYVIQHAGLKDVVNGIAALDAGGAVLAPGSEVKLTRDGSERVELVERTSAEIIARWTRAGVNDYTAYINCSGAVCTMQHSGMKDVAGGIAGLDANILLPPALLPPCLEEYSNHLGAVDNFTQTGTAGNGVAAADAGNHEMDLSSGVTIVGYGTFNTKRAYTPTTKPMIANFRVQNIVNGTGGNRDTLLGFVGNWANFGAASYAVIFQENDDSWTARSWEPITLESTAISALSNDDLVTIVVTSGYVKFFVNGVLVATHTTTVPTGAMYLGGMADTTAVAATAARQISIDFMSVKRYV